MSSNISDVGFHNGLVRSDLDYFFKKESIAAATGPAVVVEKMLGDLQGGVEIVVTVNEALTVGATALGLTINRAPTVGGTKAAAITKTIATGSYAAGTVLFRYIPGPADVGVLSLAFTSAVGNAGSIDAFQHPVAR
jgi:hypothetical protein